VPPCYLSAERRPQESPPSNGSQWPAEAAQVCQGPRGAYPGMCVTALQRGGDLALYRRGLVTGTQSRRQCPCDSSTSLALIEEQADASIRRVWLDGRWFFSLIDVVGLLTDAPIPRNYWADMKRYVQSEGFTEVLEIGQQLKLRAADGKMRATDAADAETILRLIQSIPSPKAEPIKRWLARVGAERLDEVSQPALDPAAASACTAITRPAHDAPARLWAEYHQQMTALYERQAAYEERLTLIDAQIVEHDQALADHSLQLGEMHSHLESLEVTQRGLLPELLERLRPPTLTTEHQGAVRAGVG
jgi:hypothetical protein